MHAPAKAKCISSCESRYMACHGHAECNPTIATCIDQYTRHECCRAGTRVGVGGGAMHDPANAKCIASCDSQYMPFHVRAMRGPAKCTESCESQYMLMALARWVHPKHCDLQRARSKEVELARGLRWNGEPCMSLQHQSAWILRESVHGMPCACCLQPKHCDLQRAISKKLVMSSWHAGGVGGGAMHAPAKAKCIASRESRYLACHGHAE